MRPAAENILRHIQHLVQLDRVMCSDGYDRALDYVAEHLACPDAWVGRDSFPAGEAVWGWTVPDTLRHWKDQRADPLLHIPNHRPMNLLQVRVPGKSALEILFVAHLCHPLPSANDNASGAAMMMELVRYYAEHPPQFTLRFLFTVEYWGTVAFCSRYESLLSNIMAGVSIDSVGANQDVCGSTMVVDEIPHHLASCLDVVLWRALQTASRAGRYRAIGHPVQAFRCDFQYYTGGSDHYILNDASVGIPSTTIGTDPDRFNHTRDDTIDKVSPETLGLCFSTIVNAVEQFSDATEAGDHRRAQLVLHRYEEATHALMLTLQGADASVEGHAFGLAHSYHHAVARLNSMAKSHPTARLAPWLGLLDDQFAQFQRRFTVCTGRGFENPHFEDERRYQRTFKGPLSRNALYEQIAPAEKSRIMAWLEGDSLFFHKVDAALNYCERCGLTEIAWLLRLHYGGESYESKLAWMCELLERQGLVRSRE